MPVLRDVSGFIVNPTVTEVHVEFCEAFEMPLFDQIVRAERRARRQNEGSFDYMNTSARPGVAAIRELLEVWFERLPESAKADIRARFRSRDEVQHQSAWFELFWHGLLRCSGYDVEVHP